MRSLSADAFVRALKSHPAPAADLIDANVLVLRPVATEAAAAASAPKAGESRGELYAWSQLVFGGEAMFSRLQFRVDAGPFVTIDWTTSSGTDRWYVANAVVAVGTDPPLRFAQAQVLDATVPLDAPLFTWRTEASGTPAEVTLSAESIEGEASSFSACWRVRVAERIDRTVCTRHGTAVPVRLRVLDPGSPPAVLDAQPGALTWNATPPAGTPTPPPTPWPLRVVPGRAVADALMRPAFADFETTGTTAVTLASAQAPATPATLAARTAFSSFPNPTGSWDTSLASAIDARDAVTADARVDLFRFGAGRLGPVGLALGGTRTAFPETPVPLGVNDRLPLDRTIATWTADGRTLRLVLQSIDGAPAGYRVCWQALAPGLDRLACTVHDTAGETARVVESGGGAPVVWR